MYTCTCSEERERGGGRHVEIERQCVCVCSHLVSLMYTGMGTQSWSPRGVLNSYL